MAVDRKQELRDAAKAAGVTGARDRLELHFTEQQAECSNTPTEQWASFKAVATEGDIALAAADCLFYAEEDGWGPELYRAITTMVPQGARAALDAVVLGGQQSALKPRPNGSRGLSYAGFQACYIEHTERGKLGTGILVAPDVVLTAYHVVKDYWGTPKAHEGLRARFAPGRFEPFSEPPDGRGLVVPFAPRWKVGHSPADGSENGRRRLLARKVLDQNLDFALVRLQARPGLSRGVPGRGAAVGPRSQIWIYHAPGEADIRPSNAAVDAFYWEKTPRRLQYTVPAGDNEPGSSGGGCLDSEGRLVGHHQGSIAKVAGASLCRGVPWSAVEPTVGPKALAPRKPPYLWWVRSEGPVDTPHGFRKHLAGAPYYRPLVGRHVFQRAILASMGDKPASRVFFVSGPPGAGTTLTLRILDTLLHERDHISVAIDVSTALIQGERYIDWLFTEMRKKARPETVVVPYNLSVVEPVSYGTVRSYVRARLDEMETLRDGRLVWLAIDGLRQQPPSAEFDRLSLEALAEVTPRYDWLRTVILAPRPDGLPDAFSDPVAPPTGAEMAYYVERRLAAAGYPVSKADAANLADEIASDALAASGKAFLGGEEAGSAIDAVLFQLYPVQNAPGPIVQLTNPCW